MHGTETRSEQTKQPEKQIFDSDPCWQKSNTILSFDISSMLIRSLQTLRPSSNLYLQVSILEPKKEKKECDYTAVNPFFPISLE